MTMKYILPTAMMLFSIAVLATGGGPQASREAEKQMTDRKDTMNSEKRMEERHNNASVIIGTGKGTASDGTGTSDKDIRPQGKGHNKDYSDTDLKSDNE